MNKPETKYTCEDCGAPATVQATAILRSCSCGTDTGVIAHVAPTILLSKSSLGGMLDGA